MAGAEPAIMRLQEILLGGVNAADGAALAMGRVTELAVQRQLSRMAHPPGTPSPAPVGNPPAMVSGALRDSVTTHLFGDGVAEVGGTTPYARIHQFGGWSGWGLRTHTPARPYLEKAWSEARLEAFDAAIDFIVEMVFRG